MPNAPMHVKLMNDAKLSLSKAFGQLAFVDRSYSLGLWRSSEVKELWRQDLELMLYYNDLRRITLQLLDSDQIVLFEFAISFDGSDNNSAWDTARGIELPVLDCRQVAGHRVAVHRNGRSSEYQNYLKGRWSSAKKLQTRATDEFESEHACRITGGRQTGQFRVAPDSRHHLVISSAGKKGFGFARDADLGVEGVYLERRFAPQGYQFRVGDRITAIVVQTPRGLQARNIQEGWPSERYAS